MLPYSSDTTIDAGHEHQKIHLISLWLDFLFSKMSAAAIKVARESPAREFFSAFSVGGGSILRWPKRLQPSKRPAGTPLTPIDPFKNSPSQGRGNRGRGVLGLEKRSLAGSQLLAGSQGQGHPPPRGWGASGFQKSP